MSNVYENGQLTHTNVSFDNFVMYPSAFFVVDLTEDTYSKHYYAGGQRIAARMEQNNTLFRADNDTSEDPKLSAAKTNAIEEDFKRYFKDKNVNISFDTQSYREGDIRATSSSIEELYFYHPDHLGTATFLTDIVGNPYQFFLNLPFGESMAEQRSYTGGFDNRWLFTGKELDESTGLYYFGARFYNPSTSIWLSVDPLAEQAPGWTPYRYGFNNPTRYTDPTGMYEGDSTHVDENGKVIAVVEDGDLGVYQHGKNADGGTPTQYMIEKRQKKWGTSAGGKKVGETWTELGFADFGAYSEGIVKVQEGAFIDLESNWATEQVSKVIAKNPTHSEYISKAKGGGDWDFKKHSPNNEISYGSLLFGKYASARDVGNFTAGVFAQMQFLVPNAVYDYGFGLYNQSGNNFKKSAVIGLIHLYYAVQKNNFKPMKDTAESGEHPLSRAGIEAGKSFIKSLQK